MKEIFNETGDFFGNLDENGNFYIDGKIVARVESDQVYDLRNNNVGYINGRNIFHDKDPKIKTTLKR